MGKKASVQKGRRRYKVTVTSADGESFVVDESATRTSAFADAADVLTAGLTVNGRKFDVDSLVVRRVRRVARRLRKDG